MRCIILLLFFLSLSIVSHAQESLHTEVSYEYLDKLLAVAQKNYPKARMYSARVEMGNFGIKRAKLSYFEVLSFSYVYSPSQYANAINPNFLNGYQFGFFFNIGSLLQKPSMIKQAKMEQQALQYEKEAYDLNLEADVKKRYFTYVQSLVLLRIRANALLDGEAALSSIRHKFEKGETTFENYNNVLNMVTGQQQVKITAETDVLIAKSSLEELLGEKLENIK
ncbi:TolC family protein [Dyadobacter helix]|nr:TolC family protein [Dyadobacter sp. CECT 9275]